MTLDSVGTDRVIVRVAQFLRRNYVPGTAPTRWVDAPGDEMDAWLAEAEHIVGMVLGWEECSEQIAAQAASAEAHWHGLSEAQRGEQVRHIQDGRQPAQALQRPAEPELSGPPWPWDWFIAVSAGCMAAGWAWLQGRKE